MIDQSVFGPESKENKKIVVDVDPNDEIENLKVLVTLKLTEIDPAGLQVFYRGKRIPENIKVIKLNLNPEDYIDIRRKGTNSCILI